MAKYPDIKGPGDVTPAVGVANAYDAMHARRAGDRRRPARTDGDAIRQGFYKIDTLRGPDQDLRQAVRRRQRTTRSARTTTSGRSSSTTGSCRSGRTERAADRRSRRPSMLLSPRSISGLGLGSMYGLLALGFYVTYAVSGTVNFAQGSSMMLGAVLPIAFSQTLGWPMLAGGRCWRSLLCALYGLVVELVAVRPFVRRGSDAWLMATVALGIVARQPVLFTFGKEPRSLPSPLAATPIELGGVGARRLSAAAR